jgi:aspartate/methionine/tyrosine aminotransferase
MEITPFATEQYYALYEFRAPHLLSVSDCETVSISELAQMAGADLAALGELTLGYTESQGRPELREAIAKGYEHISAEDVLVLNSPVEGIYLVMRALLEPDDEAIVLTPAYDALINLAEFASKRVHRWQLQPTNDSWTLDFDALAGLMSDRTRLVVVNFPHNPTGLLPAAADLERLVDVARDRRAWLFCDEMYRGLEFGPAPALPSAVDVYEKAVVLSGLSKSYGLPGLRAGWLVVRKERLRERLLNWKYYTSICPPAPTEHLALMALQAGPELIARNRQIIQENLALADDFFGRWPELLTWRRPQAGSVSLARINVPDVRQYCHRLAREAGVVLLPGEFMGSPPGHVRFGFGRRSFGPALAHYEAHLRQSQSGS